MHTFNGWQFCSHVIAFILAFKPPIKKVTAAAWNQLRKSLDGAKEL